MKKIIIAICVIALWWSVSVAEDNAATMAKCVIALLTIIAAGSTLLFQLYHAKKG
jgi:hypothetical protein